MPLTFDSIYKPVNDFFLSLYKTDRGSPLLFRFDKFGSVISDEDFQDNGTGNLSPIIENFSDLVNRVPVENDDGTTVVFTADTIDNVYYYQLLSPSVPFTDDDDPNKEAISSAVAKIINDAKREYDKFSAPRGNGVPSLYRPSYASPAKWYDATKNDFWTSHTFQAGESPSSDGGKKMNLWKLKVSDAVLKNILSVKEINTVKPVELYNRILSKKRIPAPPAGKIAKLATDTSHGFVATASPIKNTDVPIVRDHRTDRAKIKVTDHRDGGASSDDFTLFRFVRKPNPALNFKDRYVVNQFIKSNAPTQPVTTNSIKISFDYCRVDIRRPWLLNAFLENPSWFVPGLKKGEASSPDSHTDLSFLPISFLAIKNLSIEAIWSEDDKANAEMATDFGPFEVDSGIINNKLSHAGIQIVGWMLQKIPPLPPNGAR